MWFMQWNIMYFVWKQSQKPFQNGTSRHRKKFKCNLCEKSFKHKHVVDGHVALIHENKKKYDCASCPEVFDRILRHIEGPFWDFPCWKKCMIKDIFFLTLLSDMHWFYFQISFQDASYNIQTTLWLAKGRERI